jgi:hypothetical protein
MADCGPDRTPRFRQRFGSTARPARSSRDVPRRPGEELWSPYLPKYLDTLGASLIVIGLWSAGKNLLEGFLFWSGGSLSHRLGERGTLALVALVPLAGYIVFLTTDSVPAAIVASFLIGSWESLSSPATFAVVGLAPSRPTSARWRSRSSRSRSGCRASSVRWIGGLVLPAFGIERGVRVARRHRARRSS